MRTLVLVFHPDLSQSRANKTLTEEIEKQDDITVRRLYEIYPNGEINVETEQKILTAHDRIVLQFPFYWYSTPPLLKKWEDDVLVYGWAHGSTGDKLHGKELLVAVTTGVVEEGYSQTGIMKYTVPELLRPLQATSNLIGTKYLTPFVLYGVGGLSERVLKEQAEKYAAYVRNPVLDLQAVY